MENSPENLDPRALRPREGAAARLAAQGASAKDIAYALGISPSNARALIASTLAKLGLSSRGELFRYDPAKGSVDTLSGDLAVAVLTIPEQQPARDEAAFALLTDAELEVAKLAAQGMSNEAIAEARGTSVRTIANQVGAILRKLRVSSRADILRRCA